MPSPCGPNVRAGNDVTERQAEELLQRLMSRARANSQQTGQPLADSLRQIAGELREEEILMGQVAQRNNLLTLRAKRGVKDYIGRFKTMGEGLLAFLQGSEKLIEGARNSLDYNVKAIHGKYFGRLVAELEQSDLMREFRRSDPAFVLDIYREMANMRPGVSVHEPTTGNRKAFQIAKIVEDLYSEMVARQNRAGAHIRRVPGYIIRQTHDQMAIRAIGSNKSESYQAWSEFVRPLIDADRTFRGGDGEKILRNIHEGLYSGIHGPARDEANSVGIQVIDALADKVSANRVLWFRGPDEAFRYNQAFGTKNFKEALLSDIHFRARSIGLMESLGPTPQTTLDAIRRELQFDARGREDAAAQLDSLRTWKIQAAMDEITGRSEMPENPGMSRLIGTGKVMLQMAKMGAVTLASLSDRAFLHAEMHHQGIGALETLGKNIASIFPKGQERKRALRLMGVAMDGLLGNALSRYSSHSTTSGWAHAAQSRFFDLNLLNSWTDASKAAAGELMAAHLGEWATSPFRDLPEKLRNVLSQYDITPSRWDAIRMTSVHERGQSWVFPQELTRIPDEIIQGLVRERGLNPTAANITRERDLLETALRTYYADRIDHAIPTPGAAERKWSTMGTRAGTPLGEAVRLLMLFKSFPITVLNKIVGRHIHGRGAMSVREFITSDHRGKFDLAMMIAGVTAAGYVSGAIRDALKGRTPKPLIENGEIVWQNLNDAALRGGSLGILGDVLMSQYDRDYNNFLSWAAGPALGQMDTAMMAKTLLMRGEARQAAGVTGKLLLDNAPMINLFYVRPVLDYFVLWNLEEMLSPGTLRKRERAIEMRNRQGFIVRPSEAVNE